MTTFRRWSARHVRILSYVSIAIAVAAAIYSVVMFVGISGRQGVVEGDLHAANSRVSQLNTDVQANAEALRQANDALKAAGKPTVPAPVPTGPAGPTGATGATGPTGPAGANGSPPTVAQISAAVHRILASNPFLTKPQIVAAVANYLTTHPPASGANGSVGERGPAGPAGKNGVNGTNGKDAPPPSASQVAAAVEDYCDENDCQGKRGPTGPAGRGIASVDCTSLTPQTFTVHYDDGTSQEVTCGATS